MKLGIEKGREKEGLGGSGSGSGWVGTGGGEVEVELRKSQTFGALPVSRFSESTCNMGFAEETPPPSLPFPLSDANRTNHASQNELGLALREILPSKNTVLCLKRYDIYLVQRA